MPAAHPSPPPLERYWPSAPLRRYLVVVIVLAILPLAALVSWQIFADVRDEQRQIEANLAGSAAALAQAVDSELNASLDALGNLAHSELLQPGQADAFQRGLLQRPPARRDWHSVFLVDADSMLRFDSAAGAQPGAPVSGDLGHVTAQVTRDAQPAASGLVATRGPEGLAVLLAVPVVREGRIAYVLGARVSGAAWQRLVGAASRPDGGYVALHDARQRLIAWTLPREVPLGAGLPADAADAIRSRPFGVQRLPGPDGQPVYAAWQRVGPSDWQVQVAAPAGPIEAGHRRAILGALAASGGSLLLGVLLATAAARRISRPLQTLAARGHAGLPGRVPVREIASLRDALRAAAERDEQARRTLEADIAERRRVEGELLAAHEQLSAGQRLMDLAQEAGHVGFFHHRFGPDELEWTPGHCKLFGIDRLEPPRLAGWLERIAPGDRDRIEREIRQAWAQRHEVQTLEYAVAMPGGGARWMSSRVLLRYAPDGRPLQMTGVTVDMTDQREAELQRAGLTEQAVAARRAAEAASRAKDEFLSMLGHELRNPLGAISAAIDVLETADPAGPEAADARSIISRQTRNLAHLMNDLLDVGRVVAGKILLARQPVNLAALGDRVRRTLALTGEAARHDLRMRLEPAWVDGDSVRLEQVMTNLLTNAVKYTPAGGRIEVTTGLRDDCAVFEVTDAGIGIAPALLPHVFELFVQGERSLDRRAGGLGIGLTLVRRLVELHGGRIDAHSSEAGSRFTVLLPAIEPPALPPPDALPPSRRRRVLVIEDNRDVLAALRAKLELEGHSVSTAADGIEGLNRLLRQQPEVSIVDIGLPGLTGYELARHARAAGYAGRMIALSGYGLARDVDSAMVAGFDGYLVKPVDRGQLRASLED
ncbi:ATP-binding protein [Ramlibacter tataouinensis]|uniref:ATP-binding protein n=1 Tax=Ramlibacter tataouinensis TaxID=94132 RepID=UPI0022F3C721|nr:ATP-binding protein [Ramlibacter tataouinensis]WBY03250.1 ATP-binding protein [Ramlibacter tataouinensis]